MSLEAVDLEADENVGDIDVNQSLLADERDEHVDIVNSDDGENAHADKPTDLEASEKHDDSDDASTCRDDSVGGNNDMRTKWLF